jgi:hypothetical protein
MCDSDGTPILQTTEAISYVSYFLFVWWIWVAQVAYNMRFRQADVLHRIWARISFNDYTFAYDADCSVYRFLHS